MTYDWLRLNGGVFAFVLHQANASRSLPFVCFLAVLFTWRSDLELNPPPLCLLSFLLIFLYLFFSGGVAQTASGWQDEMLKKEVNNSGSQKSRAAEEGKE